MSKEAKHTPGPWYYKKYKTGQYGVGIPDDDTQVSLTQFHPEHDNEAKANARLIAAAPDLLTSLLECRAKLEQAMADGFLQGITETIIQADAAIEKATEAP